MSEITEAPQDQSPQDRLDSWKEIAVYLRRSVRTVMRWENGEDLPVHRHQHGKQGSVYAYRAELDDWWARREGGSEAASGVIPVFLGAMFLGPTLAMTHGIVSLRMRALASAILFFVLNLIGLGLGPLITGMISDLLEPSYGDQALRYALVIGVLLYVWCAFHYLMAGKTIREDLARAPK